MMGSVCCNEKLVFTTIRHKVHHCKLDVGHADPSLNALREETKHECICGVRWTDNPQLANESAQGQQWSEERDITPSSIAREQKDPADYN